MGTGVSMAALSMRMRKLRKMTALTPRGLALLAGLNSSHVRLIESGHREDPHCSTLAAIARVTNVPLDWLILGKGEDPVPDEVLAAVIAARAANTEAAPATRSSRRRPRVARVQPRPEAETRAAS